MSGPHRLAVVRACVSLLLSVSGIDSAGGWPRGGPARAWKNPGDV